jgi:CBS domain-containing protein
MKGLTAKDVMNAEVLSVPPDLTVHELSVFLVEHQISGAPVVDQRGELVGLVSLTDIAESDALREDAPDPEAPRRRRARSREDLAGLRVHRSDLLVRDIMTPTVFSVDPDTPVPEMARTMIAGRIHRLLVTEAGRVAGIVTSLDLLRLLVGRKAPAKASRRTRMRGKGAAALLAVIALAMTSCTGIGAGDAAPAAAPAVRPSSSTLPAGHPAVDSSSTSALPAGHPAIELSIPAGETIRGTVTLAPALQGRAPRGAALFLIARAGQEGRIVAVRKADAVTFPYSFELSGQDAMTHGAGFAGVVEITARLSRSGDAAPATGDIEGRTAGVAVGARSVRVQLDSVRP